MIGILLDNETGDLLIRDGCIVVGDPTLDVEGNVLQANQGEFKEWPLIGAEAPKLFHGTHDALWPVDAKRMLRTCGVPVKKITVTSDGINVENEQN